MSDSIRIIITRNCDEQGNGGTVVDNAAAILGTIGDVPVLVALIDAFADAYGIHEIPDPNGEDGDTIPVNGYRNVSYRMRLFATEIVSAYMQKVAAEQAREQAAGQAIAALSQVTIVEE